MYEPITPEQLEEVRRQTELHDRINPRALAVRYDAKTEELHLSMRGGAKVVVPVRHIPYLKSATPGQLAQCCLRENGNSVHWDEIDMQLGTAAILEMAFYTPEENEDVEGLVHQTVGAS